MTPDELHPILTAYRTRIQPAWSKATAHPSFEGADGSPVGQCGVTSAWLQQELYEDHGINTAYREGTLLKPGVAESDEPHCWLEIAREARGVDIIIDLTADQYGEPPIVCDSWINLADRRVFYCGRMVLGMPYGEVQQRLNLLTGALS